MEIVRVGSQHQAGSDSMLTGDIFFKLKKLFIGDYIKDMNVLYGIAEGFNENHYKYYSSLNSDNYQENISYTDVFNQSQNFFSYSNNNTQFNRSQAFPLYNNISSNIYKSSIQNNVQYQNENKNNSNGNGKINSLIDYANMKKKKIILKNIVS